MPRRQPEDYTPATLGQMVEQGLDILCWCNRCHYHAEVGSKALMGRLGPHCGVPAIGSSMRCSSCGSREIATRPAWTVWRTPGEIMGGAME